MQCHPAGPKWWLRAVSWGLSGPGASWTPKPRRGPGRAESPADAGVPVGGQRVGRHVRVRVVSLCSHRLTEPLVLWQPGGPSPTFHPPISSLPFLGDGPLGVQTIYCGAALKPGSLKPILLLISAVGLHSRLEPRAPPC